MKNRFIFALAVAGLVLGLVSAYFFGKQPSAQPPVFNPAADPYANGIYANGIIETDQGSGENVSIFPEVSGPVTKILVHEGASVTAGTPLLQIDDSVQRATYEQLRAQAEAAAALLAELKAEPRPETLAVAKAQVVNAQATLKNASDTLAKQETSYRLDPQSVSKDTLDTDRNAVQIASTNLQVVQRQYDLTRAGAWAYDIVNQARQTVALQKAADSAGALLAKYTIRAPSDGTVLTIEPALGGYVSPAGAYDTYTQGQLPLVTMGRESDQMAVRVYVDEILLHNLPPAGKIAAQMSIEGTDIKIPITYERTQPFVSPKIELSDQRLEQVDVRVLPLIFHFDRPKNFNLYPGQLVDVYIGEK